MTTTASLAFIGGGNMAGTLINGLIEDGTAPDRITVAEPDTQRREQLAARFGIHTTEDNSSAVMSADIVVLAVKPQVLKEVARSLAPALAQGRPLCISIAAGIRHAALQRWLGQEISLVRAMPNTPAMLQAGATGLYAPESVSETHRNAAEHVLRSVGIVVWVEDEALMDAVTAVSGSGPAYFFLFMEAMEQAAVDMGLPAETARLLVRQTALGATRMALESDLDLAALRLGVTSPGGTTERAIRQFEEKGLRTLVNDALKAACERSRELSEELEKE